MGDGEKRALRVEFDQRLKLEFHGTKISAMADCFFIGSWTRWWD